MRITDCVHDFKIDCELRRLTPRTIKGYVNNKNGVKPITIYPDRLTERIVFVFYTDDTKDLYRQWLKHELCEVYCNRDTITDSDDIENMIADRWLFEHKPDTYTVTITPKTFTIMEEDTQQLTVEVLKNNETVSPTPQIIYSIDEPAIVSIDPETNIATGLKEGSAIISGSYKGQDNDICVVGKSVATITPKPVVADIVITPPYPDGKTAYPVKQGYDATTFTASVSGVENPKWTIVLDAQGIASSKYTSKIDNSAGTFSVACNSKNYGTYLKCVRRLESAP